MRNANSLITIRHIGRANVQPAIIAVKKVISHMIVTLKYKTISLQDHHSPSTNHNYHRITSINIRPQGNHKVLVAH